MNAWDILGGVPFTIQQNKLRTSRLGDKGRRKETFLCGPGGSSIHFDPVFLTQTQFVHGTAQTWAFSWGGARGGQSRHNIPVPKQVVFGSH